MFISHGLRSFQRKLGGGCGNEYKEIFFLCIHVVLQNTSAIEVRPSPARFQKDSSIVVANTFLTVDAGLLIFDCCVHLPPEEDHRLPPTLGKVPSWPSLPSFVDCRCRRRTTSPLPPTASPQQLHGLIPYLLVISPSHRMESHTKNEGIKLWKFALQIFW